MTWKEIQNTTTKEATKTTKSLITIGKTEDQQTISLKVDKITIIIQTITIETTPITNIGIITPKMVPTDFNNPGMEINQESSEILTNGSQKLSKSISSQNKTQKITNKQISKK